MALGNRFQTQETAIASYNYADIAEGTGIVLFYGAEAEGNYILTTNSGIGSSTAWASSTTTMLNNVAFDVTFNAPQTIKGNLIANMPIGRTNGNSGHIQVVITVYHYDGTTETSLATATETSPDNAASVLEARYQYMAIVLPIAIRTFKKGDTLRIRITATTTATTTGYIGYDPLNRSQGTTLVNSAMKFLVPMLLKI